MEASYLVFEQKLREKDVTAYRVAKDTGLTQALFSDWKSGRSNPKADKILTLADYFGCRMEDFYR